MYNYYLYCIYFYYRHVYFFFPVVCLSLRGYGLSPKLFCRPKTTSKRLSNAIYIFLYISTRRADSDDDGMTIVFTRPPRRNGCRSDRAWGPSVVAPHAYNISYLAPAFKFTSPPPHSISCAHHKYASSRSNYNDSRTTAHAKNIIV